MSSLLLAAAAFGAGVMNAIAGGGSLLTFPALVFSGVPAVVANASSTVALFPGALASAWGYRRDFTSFEGVSFRAILIVSFFGGAVGALLLLSTPEKTFDVIVPWLLVAATLVFIFGPRIAQGRHHWLRVRPLPFLVIHFFLGIYTGYFGGALGLITLAIWSLFGLTDVKAMNPNKILLGGLTNTAAVICFVIAGKVRWTESLVMLVGAVAGGYMGARFGRRLDPRIVRGVVIAISVAATIVFFLRSYGF
jgi:uncharacterized membrane protein YfcA